MLCAQYLNSGKLRWKCDRFALLWCSWKECLDEFLGQKQVCFAVVRVQSAKGMEYDFLEGVGDPLPLSQSFLLYFGGQF